MKVLSILGTRPECIKMAPVLHRLKEDAAITSLVCVTAQHRQMLDQVLDLFQIRPDVDLNIMVDNQGQEETGAAILLQLKPVLVMREKTERPAGVAAGTAKLVGTSTERIVEEASLLLDAQDEYEKMARAHNPYGDGHASQRIVKRILDDYTL